MSPQNFSDFNPEFIVRPFEMVELGSNRHPRLFSFRFDVEGKAKVCNAEEQDLFRGSLTDSEVPNIDRRVDWHQSFGGWNRNVNLLGFVLPCSVLRCYFKVSNEKSRLAGMIRASQVSNCGQKVGWEKFCRKNHNLIR
jgi:hypothetical protein